MNQKSFVTKDKLKQVMEGIAALTSKEVLVGFPQEKSSPRKGGEITNAALGYIHEHGAPEVNIPARPFLASGVQDAEKRIISQFRQIAKKATEPGANIKSILESGFNQIGLIAVSSVQSKLRRGPFAPLSEDYLRARDVKKWRRVRRGKLSEEKFDESIASRKPLLDTRQMANAVTYVIRTNVSRVMSRGGS